MDQVLLLNNPYGVDIPLNNQTKPCDFYTLLSTDEMVVLNLFSWEIWLAELFQVKFLLNV